MTAATQSSDLFTKFDRLQSSAEQTLSVCTEDQWRAVTTAEGWTVAATAHHVAVVQRAFIGMVELFAAGETYTPSIDMEQIHASNADHALEYAEADKPETRQILEASGLEMAALIRDFDADGLARNAGTFGGNDLTVGQVIEYVVIGHLKEHLMSIQETINR